MSESFWKDNYNTKLSTEDEVKYNNWIAQQSQIRGHDMSNDTVDYDLKGYWLKNGGNVTGVGHFPDTYKKPNHPTFSTESIYHNTVDPWGGKFEGGRWIGDDKAGWSYQPSQRMLKTTHDIGKMQQYFAEFEPNSMLVTPPVSVISGKKILPPIEFKENPQ